MQSTESMMPAICYRDCIKFTDGQSCVLPTAYFVPKYNLKFYFKDWSNGIHQTGKVKLVAKYIHPDHLPYENSDFKTEIMLSQKVVEAVMEHIKKREAYKASESTFSHSVMVQVIGPERATKTS